MGHLNEVNMGYLKHLLRAWRLAFILFIHGIFPEIWKTKASDELAGMSRKSRAHMLKHMYNIEEKT
jgi:hypothetical protein